MRFILLAAFCAIAMANTRQWDTYNPESRIQDESFRSGREYRFVYNGQLASGFPGSSKQHSASRIQAIVHLIFKDKSNQVMLKLNHIRMAKNNEHIPNPQAMMPFESYEEVEISESKRRALELPLQFEYRQGMIEDVVLSGEEQPWSSNIKRGVLNMLQVNLNKRDQIQSSSRSEDPSQKNKEQSFRALENTLEGKCETLYTVLEQKPRHQSAGPVLNVTKSINFENCDRRPDIRYNFRFQDNCPSCNPEYTEEEKFMRSSTVAQYNISGTRSAFLIESARIESIYTFAPFNQQNNVITTYVNQTLRLFKSGSIKTKIGRIEDPQQSDSDLVYSPEWDVLKEKFFMEGEEEFHQETPYSDITNKVEFVETILTQLANAIRENVVQEDAPIYFNRLVKALRMLKKNQIEQVHENFYKGAEQRLSVEKSKKVRDFLIDAIAIAGTKDCIDHLVTKIQEGEIHSVKAALAIKNMINTRVISQQMIEKLMELVESKQSQRSWRSEFLDQSVLLTVGSMINGLCAPNQDKMAREIRRKQNNSPLCTPQFRNQMSERLTSMMNSAENWQQEVLLLKCMSNAGLVETIPKLAKIIRDRSIKPMIRAEAILALRQIKEIVPRQVQEILLPIFKSRAQPNRVRIAALYQIMQTQPERVVIDQIARKLQTCRNKQVASFTYSLLQSMANSTNPCEKRVARDVQTALRAGRGISPRSLMNPLRSKYVKASTMRNTFELDLSSIISSNTKLPEHISSSLHLNTMGFWSKYLVTLGLVQSETDEIVRRYLLRSPIHSEGSEEGSRGSSPLQQLKNIVKKLSIRSRESDETEIPRGFLYLKIKDQEFGFLPMGENILRELVQYGKQSFDLPSMQKMLDQTQRFELTKVMMAHEMTYKIPTSLGLPLSVCVRMPSVMHVSGTIRVNAQPQGRVMPRQLEIQTDIKPSAVWSTFVSVQTWSPILNSGAGIQLYAKAHYPLKTKINADITNLQEPVFEAKWEPATVAIKALTLSSRPYTSTRVWPTKPMTSWNEPEVRTVMGEEKNRAQQYTYEFGRQSLGINFKVEGYQHSMLPAFVPGYGIPSAPGYLLSGPNKLQVTVEPGHQMPREVVFKASGYLLKKSDKGLNAGPKSYRQTFSDSFYGQKQSETWEQNSNSQLESRFHLQLRSVGSSADRSVELETKMHMSQDLRVFKTVTKIQRSPIPQYDSQTWKMCMDSELVYPKTPQTFSEMFGKSVYSEVKTSWGQSCNQEKYVHLRVKASRSKQQESRNSRHLSYWESQDEKENEFEMSRQSPVAMYEHLQKASDLLQYNVDVQYKQMPRYLRNMTVKAYSLWKMYNYRYSQTDRLSQDLPENRIQATFSLDEHSRQLLNITIRSPLEQTILTDLPLSYPIVYTGNLKRSNRIESVQDFLELPNSLGLRPKCHVSDRRISTFDDVEYRVPVPNCWTVLAKDCRQESKPTFAVLMKNKEAGSERKQVKIISRFSTVVLEAERESYDSVVVKVNNQSPKQANEIQDIENHGHVVLRVNQEGQYVRVELPESGVWVYFDGYTANIKVSPLRGNELCGLCGHMDYDEEREFVTPNNEESNDVRQFLRQYVLEDGQGQCTPSEDLEICKSSRCSNDRYSNYNEEEKYEQGRQGRSSSRQPRHATKVLERNGEICFSKEPVARCPRNTYPVLRHQHTRVVFTCMPKSDMQAERLLERAASEWAVLDEVKDGEESFYKQIAFPKECRQY